MKRNLPLHRRKKVHPGPMTKARKERFHEQRKKRRRQKKTTELCEIQFPGVYKAPTGETVRVYKRIRLRFSIPQ